MEELFFFSPLNSPISQKSRLQAGEKWLKEEKKRKEKRREEKLFHLQGKTFFLLSKSQKENRQTGPTVACLVLQGHSIMNVEASEILHIWISPRISTGFSSVQSVFDCFSIFQPVSGVFCTHWIGFQFSHVN